MTDELPYYRAALDELGGAGVLTPEDLLDDLSLHAHLVFLHQTAEQVVKSLAMAAAKVAEEVGPDALELAGVVNGATTALAGAVHALVEAGVLPTEAEEAVTGAEG